LYEVAPSLNRVRFKMLKVTKMAKKEKDPNAVALGRKGGKARLQKLTSEERQSIATKAVNARWAKEKAKKEN